MFNKYAFVVPLKDKKGISIVNAFQSISDSSKRKPNKIWVDQGSKNNNIEIYSTYNEGKSVVAERSMRTLKKNLQKYDNYFKKCLI